MPRNNLKTARRAAGLTQQAVADKVGVTIRFYRMVESGERTGSYEMWDKLEDLFQIHQRVLRECSSKESVNGDVEKVCDADKV